jgi:hypothetical protein
MITTAQISDVRMNRPRVNVNLIPNMLKTRTLLRAVAALVFIQHGIVRKQIGEMQKNSHLLTSLQNWTGRCDEPRKPEAPNAE